MSFTACSPGCCLLRRPILLLSDKAALLFSLCNPLFIGKNRPEPSSLPPRLPRSPDVTPSSILFSLRFPPTLSALASILSPLLPFPSILEKTLYFIDFFFSLFMLSLHMRVCILLFLARTRCGSPHSSSSSSSSSLLPSLHRSCAVAFELKCCKSVIRI